MGQVILKLKKNKLTGKQDLDIDYLSDRDALPFEHEEDHREIVDKVLEKKASANLNIERATVELEEETEDTNQERNRGKVNA